MNRQQFLIDQGYAFKVGAITDTHHSRTAADMHGMYLLMGIHVQHPCGKRCAYFAVTPHRFLLIFVQVITELTGIEDDKELHYSTKQEQDELLEQVSFDIYVALASIHETVLKNMV